MVIPKSRSIVDELLLAILRIVAPIYKAVSAILSATVGGRFDKRRRNHLIGDVENAFSYLLSLHDGRVLRESGRQTKSASHSAAVIVEFAEVRFRIIRGRGEVLVQLAPTEYPDKWTDLEILWYALAPQGTSKLPSPYASLGEISLFLQEYWDVLLLAMSARRHYPQTAEKLRQVASLSIDEQFGLREQQYKH